MMTRVCAWCDAHLGVKEGPVCETHGICDECMAIHFPEVANV